jgi:hypothetical protein
MSLQQTVSKEAADVAEVQGTQKLAPVVIADPTDLAEALTAIIAILELLRAQGLTTPT